jgi:hypothetical protein
LSFRKINFRYKRAHYPGGIHKPSVLKTASHPSENKCFHLRALTICRSWQLWTEFIFNHTFTECLLKAYQHE